MVLAYNPNVNSGLLSGAEDLASAFLERGRRKGLASGLEKIQSGDWEGGVNTIAQTAQMLCEYRSSDVECLAIMKEKFEKIFNDELSVDEIIENAVEARLVEENTFAFSLAQLTYENIEEIDKIINENSKEED